MDILIQLESQVSEGSHEGKCGASNEFFELCLGVMKQLSQSQLSYF